MTAVPDKSTRKKLLSEERREFRRRQFWRKITEKLLSTKFNILQAIMAIVIAVVVYYAILKRFAE